MKKPIKSLIGIIFASLSMATAVGVSSFKSVNNEAEVAEAAVSKTVTRVYIEDQVNSNTTLLAIESISFAEGYSHTTWRSFLTSYLGARSEYNTTSGSTQPSTKGWSYMSNSEQEKYLLCPTGSKTFTMIFPEWVTALSYKAVGNNFWNWFDVNGSPVGLHSGWGIGKKVNSYIYNDGGWKMNANLDNTAQTNTWGDVTITAIASNTSSEIERKNITMSKYYLMSSESYSIFGYTFGGWFTNIGCTSAHTSLITGNSTVYAKETLAKESYLSGTMNSWAYPDDNYLMDIHENQQYRIVVELSKDTEFKVVYKGDWFGWSQVDSTSKLVTNGSIIEGADDYGTRIKVTVDIKLEIYFKTNVGSNRIWIQQDSASEAASYATTFLATITCNGSSVTSPLSSWNIVGEAQTSMEYKFSQLTQGAQNLFKAVSPGGNKSGTLVEQCVARYDYILSKYGYGTGSEQYHDFMSRTPSVSNRVMPILNAESNKTIVLAITISSIAVTAIVGYFLLKKRKEQ